MAILKEVESSHCRLSSSNSLSRLLAFQPEASSSGVVRSGWGGLKSVLSSLSSRLASLCFGTKSCESFSQGGDDVNADDGGAGGLASVAEAPVYVDLRCCRENFISAPQGTRCHIEYIASSGLVRAGPSC